MTVPKWKTLQKHADLARKGADHEKAVELYAQALAKSNVPWEAFVDMTMACSYSHKMLGQLTIADAYLTGLAEKALQRDDDAVIVKAYAELIFVLRKSGDLKRGLQLGQEALNVAKRTSQPRLRAEALLSLGLIQGEMGDYEAAQTSLNEAQEFIEPEERLKQLKALFIKSYFTSRSGKYQDQEALIKQELEIARSIDNRDWEGIALNQLANVTPDITLRRSLYEQALGAFEDAGDRDYQAVVLTNNGNLWTEFGLYKQAAEVAQRALGISRSMGDDTLAIYNFQNLGIANLFNGDLSTAIQYLKEGLVLGQKIGLTPLEFSFQILLGYCYMLFDQPEVALEAFRAVELLPYQQNQAERTGLLALQANVNFLAGNHSTARKKAIQALTILDEIFDPISRGTDTDVVCWSCYRALLASKATIRKGKAISGKAWRALEMGLKGLLIPIKNLSDAGLRRGYLHRNPFRRLLILEWLKHAAAHGVGAEEMAAFTTQVQKPGRLDEVFHRLLKVGVRLNAQRDLSRLPDEIVEEVDELTGAERIALVLLDEGGKRRLVKTLLPQPPYPVMSGKVEAPPDPDAFLAEIEPWLEEAIISKQGFIRQLNPEAELIEQRSVLVAPLISQGRLVGIIYTDLRGCFGRFDPEDLNLLGVLANQSAVALENADWSATLEKKVDERTVELKQSNQNLEQRTAELTIINRVQEGLVKRLDFQAIIDLVGDELMRVFPAPKRKAKLYSVFIALSDQQTNLVQFPYWVTGTSLRLHQPPVKLGQGLTSKVIQSHQPLVLKNWDDQTSSGSVTFDDGLPDEFAQSWLGVPILTGDKVTGVICVQDPRKDLFTASDVRLLSTLAASLGVALENARLFDETQRLLQETEQRNAELAIINSVQAALAAELNIQGIYDAVGDKIREIFHSDNISIRIYDPKTNLIACPYLYEKGERITLVPEEFTYVGFTGYVMRTREILVINENMAQAIKTYGSYIIPGTQAEKSAVYVPLIVGDEARGLVSLSSFEHEHAFSDSDVRLLQTLVNSMSVALENARLFDETQRLFKAEQERVSELEIINSIQQGLAAELDFQAIVDLVGDKLREVLHTGDLGIRWYDEKDKLLHYLYTYEHGKRLIVEPMIPTPDGIFEQVSKSRLPLIGNTVAEITTYAELIPGTDQCKSNINIPIISSDKVLGIITIENYEREYAFGEAEQRLLTTIAASLGTALENARLFDETQRLFKAEQDRVSELEIINSIQQGLAAELDFQAIINLVGDKLREVFKTPDLGITWYDEKADLLHNMYNYEHGQRLIVPSHKPTPDGAFLRITRTHQPIIWNTGEEGDVLAGGVVPGTDRSVSGVMIPVISSDRVLGLIQLENYKREHAYGESELRLLSTIAASLGSALENARLFDETQRLLKETEQRNAELAILNSVSQAMSRQLDVNAIIKIVGDQVRDTFQSEVTTIHFFDPKSNLISSPYSYDRGYVNLPSMVYGEGLTSIVIRTRQPLLLSTAEDDEKLGTVVIPDATGEEGLTQSYIGVPIIVGENIIGVVSVQSYREHAYQASHVSLLSTLASSMGVAIENARLFQAEQERVSELEIINSIQQGLAAELDFLAIIDLVGDKLREVFQSTDLLVSWYDEKADLFHHLYNYEHGKRFTVAPQKPIPGGLFEKLNEDRQPILWNTSEEGDKISPTIPGTDTSKSGAAIPVIASDRIIGIIQLSNYEREHAYGESELRLLTTISASLGTALENAHLFDETQRLLKETEQRAAELAILNSVGEAMARQLDIKTITHLVGDKVREIFAAECVVINLYEPATNQLRAPYCYDKGYLDLDNSNLVDPDLSSNPVNAAIILKRKSLLFGTFKEQADAGAVVFPNAEGGEGLTNSFMGVPIIVGEQVRGLVSVQSYREHAYDESNLRLLTTLASSMGVAIENARLFQETQRLLDETQQRNSELAIINSVQAALAAELNIQGIYDVVGDKIREIFHSDSLSIRIYDPKTTLLHYPYLYEDGKRVILESKPFTGVGFTGHILRTRETLVINEDMTRTIEKYGSFVYPGTKIDKSAVYVPLIAGDQVRGVVSMSNFEREHAFSDSDVRLLQTLVNSMSVALENARLFDETQRLLAETEQRNNELAIINSVQAALAAELNIQGIYDGVGDKIREIFHSDSLSIRIYDPKTNLLSSPYLYESGERIMPAPVVFEYIGFSGHVMHTRETLVINENMKEAMEKYGSYFLPGTQKEKSAIFVPLVVGEQARGLVSMSDFESEHAFSDSDVRLLQTLVNSMSVALENARLFNETQRLLAETEQRNNELAIINSVQAALAAELNIQGIYDAVGDKIREIFHSGNLEIRIYDPRTNLEHYPYTYENGKRIHLEPLQCIDTGIRAHVARTRETLVINENYLQTTEKFGSYTLPGTQDAKSAVYVPLIVGDQVRGMVGLSDFEREHAFSDSDVRLLQTLVNSMSVALENARLFTETQRLLEETSQRASELAIINSVSQSMSSQLQVEAIVRTVGDQVRDSFHSEVVNIYLYDPATSMIHLPYSYDRQYVTTPPFAYGSGLTSKVMDAKQPLILGSFEEITSGGAILTPNAPDDELMPQSYLGVPIIVGEKAIGVIDVQSYKQFVYDDSRVRLLSTLASSMGVALENARLFEETRRLLAETEQRNRELAIISRIGQSLAGQLDPQGIFELVGEELQQVFDAQVVAIITYDRQENLAHWRYSIEKGERQSVAPHPPGGFSGHILRTRQPLLITHDVAQRAVELGSTVLAGEAPKSYLGVPLIAGGEVTGVITLQNIDREEAFSEDDLRLLSTLALSMGVTLENARLYQETQHHAVEMAALAEIGSDIASTHEMEPVLERMATKTRELMEVRDIAMYLLQPDGHTLKPIVSQGKYAEETKAQMILLGTAVTGSIAQSGVAEIVNYPERDPRALHIEGTPPEEEDLECIMLAPLISRGRVIGVMSVYRDRDQGLFTQLELDFLVSLARQAAIAIESARLYAETERRATEMAALAEVSREISATLELHVVLERIAGQARELLAAGSSAVYLLQPDGKTIKAIAAEGDIADEVLADEVQLGIGIVGSIVQSGVAEWINDTGQDTRGVQIPGTQEIPEGEKLMVAPLLTQERAIGALAVWRDPDDPPFNQAELSFAIGLAQQAVVAIENARLFETAQESQRRMADIIDFLPDATLVIDRQGKVIAWNHAIEEMTGVKAADILGKGDYEYALPFYSERRPILIDMVLIPDEELESKYAHIQRNEGVLVGEAYSQLKGQMTYLNATASALKNSKGEAVGAIESIRDITDQKRAEQELHQAKVEAEAANQAKSAFLAMMSHEIRTPMNAIIGMSGLLMDTSLNPDQREFAETIRSSGDSLLTIINDILDFSKIEAGKMTLEEQPFDLRECIEASLDLMKMKASEKGLELAYQMEPGVPPALLGDVTRLRQVLINLLGNSVKFTEQGEIVLTVSKGEKKGSLHFSVRDTGIGIPPDRVSQLFRPFTQADTSTSRRYGGTGLGLALSSRLVDLMGGRMWVESEGVTGKGSTFHFIIFAKPAPDWKGQLHMQGEHPQLRGRRMLVVDDNATNRRILELQTQNWGMLPRGCPSGSEALEILRKGEPFDLAILDMHMPEMSGVDLASEIRKMEASHPGAARLPLVLSTSLGGREEARESMEFTAILLKPIRQSALFDVLINVFAGEAEPVVKPAPERVTLDPGMASRRPLRILLAEDNVVNQKLALRLLSQMSYRADVAANGLEVLQAVKRQPYDVIFMDVQMPEMDGLEATRRLCAELSADKRPRIIAMTANAMQGDREICLEAGMDDYLSKPIRVEELVAALNLAKPLSSG